MKPIRFLSILGVASLSTFLAATQACGGDDSSASNADGGGGEGGSGGNATGQPPAKPSGPQTTSTTDHNFAVSEILLGDATRNGPPSSNAWKSFGYNLDGKVSTKSSKDGCKLVEGAASDVSEDGDNGIDNSFGANILPLVTGNQADAPALINSTFTDGKFTFMFDVTGLSGEPTQTATGLSNIVLLGGNLGKKPTFTTADHWPVRPETLNVKTDPKSSKIKFTDAYVVNGTYVARGDLSITLIFGKNEIVLDLKKAIITFDYRNSKAENGTIAGVLNTEQFIAQFKKTIGNISTQFCGTGADPVVQVLRESQDIMADGSAGSPSQECNGISIGLGFNAGEIALPEAKDVTSAATPGEDRCAAK